MSIYSFFYEKKDILFLSILTLGFLILIKLGWHFSLISILLLSAPIFLKRISYTQLTCFCLYGSIFFAYFLLKYFLTYDIPFLLPVAILSLLLMCILAIMGIFEGSLKRFLIYSNVIQTLFVLLDLSIAKLTGKISALGTIQIFNYTIAGLLFFVTLGILSLDNKIKNISNLFGSYYKDRLNSISAIIAALSLAGLPGLNIFVSEWLLFKTSYTIEPTITIFGIFLALLLFIMYFKIVNILMVGESKALKRSLKLTYLNIILAVACILFGLLPQLQIYILNAVMR
jgi:formate hydrogenlyase subunit 3/multisubunit Na+/H+ antiporter MnhD subunit